VSNLKNTRFAFARPTRLLVTAYVALGLLEKTNNGYRNTPLADKYLTANQQYDLSGLIRMFDSPI